MAAFARGCAAALSLVAALAAVAGLGSRRWQRGGQSPQGAPPRLQRPTGRPSAPASAAATAAESVPCPSRADPGCCDPAALADPDAERQVALASLRLFGSRPPPLLPATCARVRQSWAERRRAGCECAGRVADGACVELGGDVDRVVRTDVWHLRGPPRDGQRGVFIDAGAHSFARFGTQAVASLGSLAAFACGYPGGHAFHFHALEPDRGRHQGNELWTAFKAMESAPLRCAACRKMGRNRVRTKHRVPNRAGGIVAYPNVVNMTWAALGPEDGEAVFAATGTAGHIVDPGEDPNATARAHIRVPVVGAAGLLRRVATPADFVILKLDIESAEHAVLRSLIGSGELRRMVDEVFLECHHPVTRGPGGAERKARIPECAQLRRAVIDAGVPVHDWE